MNKVIFAAAAILALSTAAASAGGYEYGSSYGYAPVHASDYSSRQTYSVPTYSPASSYTTEYATTYVAPQTYVAPKHEDDCEDEYGYNH